MADNVTFASGSYSPPNGTVVATDEVGGAHYQYLKLTYGADGTATKVEASAPLPVGTELPDAEAMSDTLDRAKSAPIVGAFGLLDNGTNAVRAKSITTAASVSSPVGVQGVAALLMRSSSEYRIQQTADQIGDNSSGTTIGAVTNRIFNGSTFDRIYNNTQGTLLASAARTADATSSDQTNYNAKAVVAILNLTAFTTAASLTLTLQGKDPISSTYYDLDTGVAITATGLYVYEVGLGLGATATGNVTRRTSGIVPRTFRVKVAHGNANSHTYSVGYFLGV